MKTWLCENCETIVTSVVNSEGREEPSSKYWKVITHPKIEEAYCSAQCSLDKHERDKVNN